MGTSHRVYSELFHLSNFVIQNAVSQGKNLIIDTLREYFKQDVLYRYETNAFGFPLTPDLTDLPPDIEEKRTTRIYIGDIFRLDKRFFPSVVVRYSSGKTYHVSFNQDYTTKYRLDLVIDGYGGQSYIRTPTHTVVVGAWDQTFDVQLYTESVPDREELTDIISSFFIGKIRQEIFESGLFIRSVSIGSESEEDWGNNKIYKQNITLDTFSEWRREIPIDANNLVETINFCFNYGIVGANKFVTDISIVTQE